MRVRRALVTAALCILMSAATAQAECAWLLWSHNDFRIEGVPEVTQDRWVVQDCVGSRGQCMARLEQLGVKAADMRIIEQGETLKVWTAPNPSPGVGQRVRLQCLPDTIDPRGPKGIGR